MDALGRVAKIENGVFRDKAALALLQYIMKKKNGELSHANLTDSELDLLVHLPDEEQARSIVAEAEAASGRLSRGAAGEDMRRDLEQDANGVLGKRAERGW